MKYDLAILKENTTQTKVKRANQCSVDFNGSKDLFEYKFIESLILAQDERWRRA